MIPMPALEALLRACATGHRRLCPRQVLGVRMGLLGGRWLGLELPRPDKRLLALVETDGCAVSGVTAATGCRVDRRTLRVIDFGKAAATFVDTHTGQAVRVAPAPDVRERAGAYAPEAGTRWQAQLLGYQRMPDAELLVAQAVALAFPLEELLGQPGRRVSCQACGEEIINQRELYWDGLTLCRACAGQRYYQPVGEAVPLPVAVRQALGLG